MKRLNFAEMQRELEAKGIPELARKLKEANRYDASERKKRLNPTEYWLINASRRSCINKNTGQP